MCSDRTTILGGKELQVPGCFRNLEEPLAMAEGTFPMLDSARIQNNAYNESHYHMTQ